MNFNSILPFACSWNAIDTWSYALLHSLLDKYSLLYACSLEGDNPLPESLLPLCDELESVIKSLCNLVEKMKGWSDSVVSLNELLTAQHKQSDIIFQVRGHQ